MFKEKVNTKFLLFYFIIVYIIAFLFWWSFLLYTKVEQHFSDAVNYRSLQHEVYGVGTKVEYYQTEEFKQLDKDFERQKLMIITEGCVFFFVLFLGMLKVNNSFKQEIAVARQQKNFILSITHELKSPISSIKLMNETLKLRDLPREKQQQLLDSSLQEVNRLEGLVENILIAAKIENNKYGFNKEELDLSTLCKQVALSYQQRFPNLIKMDIEEQILFKSDKICINSILTNLIDNALKYAEKTSVTIRLNRNEKQLLLSIEDEGNGITNEEKDKIFDKFYRVGNEETRAAKGTGLGLFIVKQLVLFHNGKISIEDNQPKGTIFKMIFTV